jgi:hypothetical protein
MNNQFDELAKTMAQSITRRAALKKLGIGLGVFALAALGFAQRSQAADNNQSARRREKGGLYARCYTKSDCQKGLVCRYSALRVGNVCMPE